MLFKTLIPVKLSPDELVGKFFYFKWVFLSEQQEERKEKKE